MPAAQQGRDVALVSQMRAGTHYMCAALRLGLEAQLLRPHDGGTYIPMSDEKILSELNAGNAFTLAPPRAGHHIYFSHYYHPHHHSLPPMPRLSLIGFPLDSFYSDGVVYSDTQYSAGPSALRQHAKDYVFRHQGPEWNFLEERMHQNAQWLDSLGAEPNSLVVRYEDLSDAFDETRAKIEQHVGAFYHPVPRPIVNRSRTFWTGDFASRFDAAALSALRDIFAPAIRRFYPEQAITLGLV